MLTILPGSGGGGRGSVAALGSLYIRGDDDGLWYSAGLRWQADLGIYIWDVGLAGSLPSPSFNISDRVLGAAYFAKDADNTWHTFTMTPTDPPVFGYVWTDSAQLSTTPHVFSIRPNLRADDGLYIVDMGGAQIHKMGVTGGLWADLTQGYTIPM